MSNIIVSKALCLLMASHRQVLMRVQTQWGRIEYPAYGSTIGKASHWGRVTHICVAKLNIIGSGNSLSPGRRQAIIWTNAGILLIIPLGTNFYEILIQIYTFSFKKMHFKMSAKWRPMASILHQSQCLNRLFYHDVGENCWPQPIRSLKLGHVTGQGSMSPTWVGRVSDPGKTAFIKNVKTWIILLYI